VGSSVTAVFYGLMVLVPNPGNKSAEVVVVNGDFGGVGSHRLRLAIDADAIGHQDGDVRPDEFLVIEGGRRLAIWNLTHTEISFGRTTGAFVPSDNYADKDFLHDPVSPTDVGNEAQWNDLRWLGNVSRSSTNSKDDDGRYVDSDYLRPHTHADSKCDNPTDSLIHLNSGFLFVDSPHSQTLRESAVSFTEAAAGTSHTRSITDHFSLAMTFTDDAAIILKPFGGGTRYIHFRKGVNTKAIFSALPTAAGHTTERVTTIEHFRAYYSLLKDPLYKRLPVVGPRGISSTECPPAVARAR